MADAPSPKHDELGRFVPGNPGNPNGRPRAGLSIAELFRSYLEEEDKERRKPRVIALAERLYGLAMDPESPQSVHAAKALLEWGVPKPPQRVDLNADKFHEWAEAFDKLR